ncbi:BspA family leucine-rich repeat surface protein [Mycoplasma mycoides]|uniref:BspA family leucine-rich repeat surface protein n=1 Tax=Mycoplasma mycoides TaxID=2102 RepID=UPI00223F6CDF|nr:BspA family leucine-rich repeat surface protein [Mycoplasma mycoides]QVK09358.1 BspA family leucine-rich repeat surface protein [Mycoplasma mycoides subsp. capri]
MKKLLTMLSISSSIFLITTATLGISNYHNKNYLHFSQRNISKEHKIENGVLKEVGYYLDNGVIRIKGINYKVHVIAAQLPKEIKSLKGAFQTNNNNIRWQVEWDTSNITDMSYAFYNTNYINDKSISKWNTSNVTNMEGMFGLTKSFNQNISSWDVSKVKNMKKMFEGSTEFNNNGEKLDWGKKLKNVKTMEGMFNNAKQFTHSLSDWVMPNVVENKDFGLEKTKQPIWKAEESKPKSNEVNITQPSDGVSPKNTQPTEHNSTSNSESEPNDMSPKDSENSNQTEDIKNEINNQPLNDEDNNQPMTPTTENETTETEKTTNDSSNDLKNDIYTIPSKPNTINSSKQKSSKTLAITMGVLGSATILGVGSGVSYYYRKNLRDFYLKTKNKIFKSK